MWLFLVGVLAGSVVTCVTWAVMDANGRKRQSIDNDMFKFKQMWEWHTSERHRLVGYEELRPTLDRVAALHAAVFPPQRRATDKKAKANG